MRRMLLVAAVIAQVLVLLTMVGKREYILATGDIVFLQTAPIDPRDPFRGDFVRLNYDIAQIPKEKMRGALPRKFNQRGQVFYAALAPVGDGVMRLDYASDEQPSSGLFIRGRLREHRHSRRRRSPIVKYGIEQYFVEQHSGHEIEKHRGSARGLQIPMEIEVALGADGTGVIKGFRWSKVGIKLEFLETPQRGNDVATDSEVRRSPKVRVTLKNVSTAQLMLTNPGDNCAIHLVSTTPAVDTAQTICTDSGAKEAIDLDPDQEYSTDIDLALPRWHVISKGQRMEIGATKYASSRHLRLQYRPDPNALETIAGLWHGSIKTGLFSALRPAD